MLDNPLCGTCKKAIKNLILKIYTCTADKRRTCSNMIGCSDYVYGAPTEIGNEEIKEGENNDQ